jgi:hypothetical protein
LPLPANVGGSAQLLAMPKPRTVAVASSAHGCGGEAKGRSGGDGGEAKGRSGGDGVAAGDGTDDDDGDDADPLTVAAAATLRVCLRTQLPLELSAVLQSAPSSTSAASLDELFRHCGKRPVGGADHHDQKLHKVALRVARKLCLVPPHGGGGAGGSADGSKMSPSEYLLLLTRVAEGNGAGALAVGSGAYANVHSQEKARRRQDQAASAEMELGCIRVMLGNDGRAAELVHIAAVELTRRHYAMD